MATVSPLTNDKVDPEIEEYLNKTITEEITEISGKNQV